MCTWMIASRSLLLAQAHTQHTFIIIINTPHIPKFHTSTQVYSSTYIHAPTIPACKSAHSKINKNKYKIKKKKKNGERVCVSSKSLCGGWADVGLWVAVCFLAKISLHRSTCKTTFASLTQSRAISQSFRVFISFRSMRDTTSFHFSKIFLIQNYRFLYHGDQKISWLTLQVAGSQLRNPPVKFRHERWLHLAIDLHPACPNRGRLELWPRKWFLLVQNRNASHVDRSTH